MTIRVALAQFSGHIDKNIDPKTCDDVRDLWGFFRFRRPDAYGDVLKEKL
jgi:hypothetical protein